MTVLFFNFVQFSILGGSEGEQDQRSDEIITKEKKSSKKVNSVSGGKRLKKEKNLSYGKESDEEKQEPDEEKQEADEEEQDYGERLSEDRDSVPQGVQNDDEEISLKEKDVDESRGDSRENVNGEEESGSERNQNDSEGESSPRKVKKSLIEITSPDDAKIADISDDEPLVNNSVLAELQHLVLFIFSFFFIK